MLFGLMLAILVSLGVIVAWQMRRALGARRGTQDGILLLLVLAGAWGVLEWSHRRQPPPPEDQTASAPMQAQSCAKCHESHYASWQRTFHRTMTREATPENVKGVFDGVPRQHLGVTARLTREGDNFFMDLDDERPASRPVFPSDQGKPPAHRRLSIDRLVGSHWFQQFLHRDEEGRYFRLPMAYHIVEKRWIHITGAFLGPDTDNFFDKLAVWNESCLYCHNTRPVKNPLMNEGRTAIPAYHTEVGELGISCEACHGAGESHIRAHENPARRLAQRYADEPDLTIVNPVRLPVKRSDQICARCHGGPMPRYQTWNPYTYADPFLAGRELTQFWHLAWSEEEMRRIAQEQGSVLLVSQGQQQLDGRFWGDGTPLTTALEYQGMALSACYQKGNGKMSCLTCHSLHQGDRNHQVKEGMRTNAACYSCHESYREKLVEHTHHPVNSAGSLCHNCHMPNQVYALLDTHRSHRIAIPRVRDSLGTGKPHACNLCHLDKSLGWTQEQLGKWYGTKPEKLSDDDQNIASSVLHLACSDARSRAIVAGAFSWPAAQEASGRDWPAVLLPRVMEHERFPAVRYLSHRALRSLHGEAAAGYDYLAAPPARSAQLQSLRSGLEKSVRVDSKRYPYLPLRDTGVFADDVFQRLLRLRKDPDVFINE